MRRPGVQGLAAGVLVPFLMVLAPLVTGDLAAALEDPGIYFLLPAFSLMLVPSVFLGLGVAGGHRDPRAIVRLSAGTLVTGCLVGSVLLFLSYDELPLGRRLVLALAGGPALVGFWVWLGVTLGAYIRMQRRESAAAPPA